MSPIYSFTHYLSILGMTADEMFSSMQLSMTTSLQLAKDCMESEPELQQKPEPIEGVQKFALMIDSGMFSFISRKEWSKF